ncbi:hypothetical protein B0T16DRAFT_388018 [Cercophora newfieldiana]|uniref:Uncharacterized protein n=1 Tax=Cercophora newfieldiana TaxID=92897 RepID=A0AA39YHP0_9PEZI|nr:hypothetical protein B0T16DRAFT_388018 [Cercophora newfieldiana]
MLSQALSGLGLEVFPRLLPGHSGQLSELWAIWAFLPLFLELFQASALGEATWLRWTPPWASNEAPASQFNTGPRTGLEGSARISDVASKASATTSSVPSKEIPHRASSQ